MHHHRVSVSKTFVSAVLCLAMITASLTVFSSCTVRVEPQIVNTPEQTETDDDKEKQKKPAGSAEIVNKAIELAWPYGTPAEVYKYDGGSPKDEFKSALDAAYPDRSGWGKKPKAGASCDVFVGTVIRTAGFDERFPRGLDEQETHTPTGMVKHVMYNADMYKQSAFGDIIWYDYSGPGGHVLIRGKNCIYQAGYQSTYGHTTDGLGEIKDVEPKVIIFRPKNYLQKGDTGVEVKRLQSYLNWYTNGEFYKKCGKADGIYGNNTLKYVKKMQTNFFGAKNADGLVGAKTIAAMKKVKK